MRCTSYLCLCMDTNQMHEQWRILILQLEQFSNSLFVYLLASVANHYCSRGCTSSATLASKPISSTVRLCLIRPANHKSSKRFRTRRTDYNEAALYSLARFALRATRQVTYLLPGCACTGTNKNAQGEPYLLALAYTSAGLMLKSPWLSRATGS